MTMANPGTVNRLMPGQIPKNLKTGKIMQKEAEQQESNLHLQPEKKLI